MNASDYRNLKVAYKGEEYSIDTVRDSAGNVLWKRKVRFGVKLPSRFVIYATSVQIQQDDGSWASMTAESTSDGVTYYVCDFDRKVRLRSTIGATLHYHFGYATDNSLNGTVEQITTIDVGSISDDTIYDASGYVTQLDQYYYQISIKSAYDLALSNDLATISRETTSSLDATTSIIITNNKKYWYGYGQTVNVTTITPKSSNIAFSDDSHLAYIDYDDISGQKAAKIIASFTIKEDISQTYFMGEYYWMYPAVDSSITHAGLYWSIQCSSNVSFSETSDTKLIYASDSDRLHTWYLLKKMYARVVYYINSSYSDYYSFSLNKALYSYTSAVKQVADTSLAFDFPNVYMLNPLSMTATTSGSTRYVDLTNVSKNSCTLSGSMLAVRSNGSSPMTTIGGDNNSYYQSIGQTIAAGASASNDNGHLINHGDYWSWGTTYYLGYFETCALNQTTVGTGTSGTVSNIRATFAKIDGLPTVTTYTLNCCATWLSNNTTSGQKARINTSHSIQAPTVFSSCVNYSNRDARDPTSASYGSYASQSSTLQLIA